MTMQEMESRVTSAERHFDELMKIQLENSELLGRLESVVGDIQKDHLRHLENHSKYIDPKIELMWEDKIERRGGWGFLKGGWGMVCAIGAGLVALGQLVIAWQLLIKK